MLNRRRQGLLERLNQMEMTRLKSRAAKMAQEKEGV